MKSQCPNCKTVYRVPSEKAIGKATTCKKCRTKFRVRPLPIQKPSPTDSESTPADAFPSVQVPKEDFTANPWKNIIFWISVLSTPIWIGCIVYLVWPKVGRTQLQHPESPSVEAQQPESPAAIIERSENSVALIKHNFGSGTGFMVAENLLMTNAHVTQAASINDITIYFPSVDKTAREADRIILEEPARDLCVIELMNGEAPLPIDGEFEFKRGENITIIGNPGVGNELILENAVTTGLLSSVVTIDGYEFYQLSTSINPGNSGGPVLNSVGKVIAVVTLKASQEGIAFGVPAADIRSAVLEAQQMSDVERAVANEQHLAKSVFRKLALAGWVHLTIMDLYAQLMNYSIQSGGTASEGLAKAKQELAPALDESPIMRAILDVEVPGNVRVDLRAVQNSERFEPDTKKNFRQLWATVQQAKSYVDEPRGSYNSYSEKTRELRDEFDRLVEVLQIQLDVTIDFEKIR